MRMQVLGPVRVWHGDDPVDLGSTGERAVLGLLALAGGQALSRAELVDALWGSQPPPTARNIIQTRIKRLRRALEPRRRSYTPSSMLPTVGDGYAFDTSVIDLDLSRFRQLVAHAATARQGGDFPQATALLAEALELWQGEPLADIPTLAAHQKVATLADQRRMVRAQYGEALLATGAIADAVVALEEAVADQPLDEAVVALLVRAYRAAGQRARAFAVYHATRQRLVEELGIDPGPELATVHTALLTDEPAGAPLAPARVAPAPPGVPAQLPIDLATFVGRIDDLSQLDKHHFGAAGTRANAVVVCVCGTAGVGKTTLVTHWAHRMTEHFPDGQLFADLRGFAEHGASTDPADMLREFLEALQVPAARIPSTADGRANLYRSQLAGRRMLIVLDNARDAEQVRPLLPGSLGCLVLVTSRNQLTGLVAANGAYPLRLDLLAAGEARQLLERRLGTDRIAGEPRAVDEIVSRCAGLPLALAVVAARAATYPDFRLDAIATELQAGLSSFVSGDGATDLWTVFSTSYNAIGPGEQRLFRLLSLHPGPDITAEAAASLAVLSDARLSDAQRYLAELTRTHLITEHRPGRYTVHDLLRAYAADLAATLDSSDERLAAQRRMLSHYCNTAQVAGLLIDPYRTPVGIDTDPVPVPVEGITDAGQAMAWFAAERSVLIACVASAERAGLDAEMFELAQALASFLQRRGHHQDMADTQLAALRAAQRIGGPGAQARSHRGVATAYFRQFRYEEVRFHLQQALNLCRRAGDAHGTAYSHLAFCTLLEAHGRRYDAAIDHGQQALDLFEEAGDLIGQSRAHNAIGWTYTRLGEHRAAIAACERALVLLEETGDRYGQGMTWDTIACAQRDLGDHEHAITSFRRAIELLRDTGDRYIAAVVLDRLGDLHAILGDLDEALAAWRGAVGVLDDLGHPTADEIRKKLRKRR